MPTGYTADIEKGITFQQFALNCAQAFGACISMRDDPIGTPIPDEFEPSTYNRDRLRECRERIAQIEAMTDEECAKEADKEYTDSVAYHNERIEAAQALRRKYDAMLVAVRTWTPPTDEHNGLKEFMEKQIVESREFDCGTKYHRDAISKLWHKSGPEWRRIKLEELGKDVSRHEKEWQEEQARVAERNEWVRKLRESLKTSRQ